MRTRCLAMAITVGLLLACVPPAAAVPASAAPATVASPESRPWAKRITGYLKVKDGTRLHYSVLLPARRGRFPVVMNYSGYDAGSIGGSAYRRGDTTMWAPLDTQLLRNGYAVLGVNIRGTGCSDGGAFDLFSRKWGKDGRDAVEWAARQKWSTGRIGMANWSFAGLSQVFTAAERPAHLRAIAPGMVVTDPLRDVSSLGGVPNFLFPFGWWEFIQMRWDAAAATARAEDDGRCLANIADHKASSTRTSPPAQQAKHPFYDRFIARRDLSKRTHRINVPVLSLETWQDEATGVRGGHYQRTLDPKRTWYVSTNGRHDIYTSTRWRRLLVRFFDRFLKERRNGFGKEPHVRIWQDTTAPGAPIPSARELQDARPSWVITLARLPVVVKRRTLWLRPEGRLTTKRPAAATGQPSPYAYPGDSPNANPDILGVERDWRTTPPSLEHSAVFTTSPLQRSMTFFGPASADLWVSSTATDTDLQVTVTEVRPDGREQYVQRGWLRLSQRAIDRDRSTALLPIHPQTAASVSLLSPGNPVLGRVEIQKFSHTFRAGSSIRIWIDTPSITGEAGFDFLQTPAVNKVWHDAAHPSRIVLGRLPDAPAPKRQRDCDRLISEPCRPDPIGRAGS